MPPPPLTPAAGSAHDLGLGQQPEVVEEGCQGGEGVEERGHGGEGMEEGGCTGVGAGTGVEDGGEGPSERVLVPFSIERKR